MFPDSGPRTMHDSLASPSKVGMIVFAPSQTTIDAVADDFFLAPWMTPTMSDVEDDYFDDLDDEDFDDEFDDDFEEELDDDLAALNPEVTEEDLVEADDDLGGMFEDDEEGGGAAREESEPAAEPEEEE
jgi:hypothetical protein